MASYLKKYFEHKTNKKVFIFHVQKLFVIKFKLTRMKIFLVHTLTYVYGKIQSWQYA